MAVAGLSFAYTELTEGELALQAEVRDFLAEELPLGEHRPGLGMGARHDPVFTKKLADPGWLGMALPKRYGGHDRTAVDRFVVVQELLRWGAPVAAHWTSDRQTGPTLLKFGTEEQRREFLPRIAAGECFFSIGMSEPDSGSDLASVASRATRAEGGWLVNGTKIWTSGAHHNHYFVALVRTAPMEDGNRHQGLSQLLIDLSADSITINPIPFLDGRHDFNEVVMEDVFVPDDAVIGEVGMGWNQVNSELAYQRAGPDRCLSTYLLVEHFIRERLDGPPDDRVAAAATHRSLPGAASDVVVDLSRD